MTIKEQFISEIKERIALQKDLLKRAEDSARIEGSIDALQGLLNSMDTLSEEPDKSLEEEIREYMSNDDNNPYDWDWRDKRDCARHFAQWGAEHTPLPEDTVIFHKGIEEGKRLMMEEAVEGEAEELYNDGEIHCTVGVGTYFKPGDKVYVLKAEEEQK